MTYTDEFGAPQEVRTYLALRHILQNHCALHRLSDSTVLAVSLWFVVHIGGELRTRWGMQASTFLSTMLRWLQEKVTQRYTDPEFVAWPLLLEPHHALFWTDAMETLRCTLEQHLTDASAEYQLLPTAVFQIVLTLMADILTMLWFTHGYAIEDLQGWLEVQLAQRLMEAFQ
jgi:hypothetical protein